MPMPVPSTVIVPLPLIAGIVLMRSAPVVVTTCPLPRTGLSSETTFTSGNDASRPTALRGSSTANDLKLLKSRLLRTVVLLRKLFSCAPGVPLSWTMTRTRSVLPGLQFNMLSKAEEILTLVEGTLADDV